MMMAGAVPVPRCERRAFARSARGHPEADRRPGGRPRKPGRPVGLEQPALLEGAGFPLRRARDSRNFPVPNLSPRGNNFAWTRRVNAS